MDDDHVQALRIFMMFASANADALKGLRPILQEWRQRKPVIGCLVSPSRKWDTEIKVLEDSGALVDYPTPEKAAAVLTMLWQYQMIMN